MKTPTYSRPSWLLGLALLTLLPVIAPAQSLWHEDSSKPMYADKRATSVGDIITIMVQENSTAKKSNGTKTDKSSSLSAAITSFLYQPGSSGFLTQNGKLPAMAYNSDSKFDGGGAIDNSENIIAKIAVRIVDVLPNNNFIVEGKRETAFSGEKQTIILRGVVRANDVTPGNNVYSYNVADATIQIIGKGTVSDSQRKGWFTRIWDKINPL
jgi:flagellar L-ring protein precursor FlgH